METAIGEMLMIGLIGVGIVVILLTIRWLWVLLTDRVEVVIPDVARHEYPKKEEPEFIKISQGRTIPNPDYVIIGKDSDCDAGVDCLGECKTVTTGGELLGLYSGCKPIKLPPGDYVYNECRGNIPIDYYMKRGNKRYFRGDNIKVVITVKGKRYDSSI